MSLITDRTIPVARGAVIIFVIAAMWIAPFPIPASGRELWQSRESGRTLDLDTALKGTLVAARAPDDPVLYPERDSAMSLWRARFGARMDPPDSSFGPHEADDGGGFGVPWHIEAAYEQRIHITSEGAGAAAGLALLPSGAKAPYRLGQLDWQIASAGTTYSYRHEIDRANASLDFALGGRAGHVTVGRQAVGLGRGVIFNALDVFAPFSLVEVDREWRRGIDAVRFNAPTGERSDMDIVGAAGETWEESALIGNFRGFNPVTGNEAGIIGGKRARDGMLGISTSFRAGGAALYFDAAAFRVPESDGPEWIFGLERYTARVVAGVFHRFGGGGEPTLLAEYHYSGFGAAGPGDIQARLADPVFVERLLRGDVQIMGRHAFAAQALWEVSETWTIGPLVIVSPTDGSGEVEPTFQWDFSDNATVLLSGFIPFGRGSRNGIMKSEYGSSPMALFLQLSLYD